MGAETSLDSVGRVHLLGRGIVPSAGSTYHDSIMAQVYPGYSRNKVNKAGQTLVDFPSQSRELTSPDQADELGFLVQEYSEALDIIGNWRAAHAYPMLVFRVTLQNRARAIDERALVAQRLKRMSSIRAKLERFENMQLARMQDIGGCRAILRKVSMVDSLVTCYENRTNLRATFVDKKDYIDQPKDDGYRGVHLVYKYRTNSLSKQRFNGLQIELQFRTRLQHAWATAVETVSTFTGQALKARGGEAEWKRFFCLMGSAIARKEGRRWVPATPKSARELVSELRYLAEELRVITLLAGWRIAVDEISTRGGEMFLLELDTRQRRIRFKGFQPDQIGLAAEAYRRAEKDAEANPDKQAVLVTVSSVQALQSAYPNYFADTGAFIRALEMEIKK